MARVITARHFPPLRIENGLTDGRQSPCHRNTARSRPSAAVRTESRLVSDLSDVDRASLGPLNTFQSDVAPNPENKSASTWLSLSLINECSDWPVAHLQRCAPVLLLLHLLRFSSLRSIWVYEKTYLVWFLSCLQPSMIGISASILSPFTLSHQHTRSRP